jgi:tetratricopeptide (TPR) repeat protein
MQTEGRMRGARTWCRSLVICAFVLGLVAIAAPGYAQTGQIKGKIVDASGKPIEGASVVIEGSDSGGRKFTVKTNKTGDYIQIGLQPGQYKITATKDAMSSTMEQRISLDMAEVNFTLRPGAAAGGNMSDADRKKAEAKNAAIKTAFDEGVALSNAGKNDEAIAKFNEVIAILPKCSECYVNIGANYANKKDWAQAEAAYKKASEQDPTNADSFNGLANVYNAQKKFDQAAEASAQAMKLASAPGAGGAAGGGASASALFNQGVILWNAGKIPDAKKQFEDAVKLDPKLADAHYWLGMANLNEGKMPDAAGHFDEYLKLAPTGQYAEQAKGILTQIKK